ncbi:phage minor head protein [Cupriavidus gilardii]|uniref:phage minor head protein n=1 Tax=Cupriavidus gilardii TaxID=82541 RepID=UPI0036F242F9
MKTLIPLIIGIAVFTIILWLFRKRRVEIPPPQTTSITRDWKSPTRSKDPVEIRRNAIASFERDKAAATSVGSSKYVWRSCRDEDVCPICAKNDGKKFSWNKVPTHGHPGYGTCGVHGYCRCYAEAILPTR